jgi:hypothetical protein
LGDSYKNRIFEHLLSVGFQKTEFGTFIAVGYESTKFGFIARILEIFPSKG